ncbi:MAG: methyltransferase domain-containing protein, partial [Thermomicrobiales bacterium]
PRLVEIAGIKPGDRVLDVACGTGVSTRVAAERAGVTGRVVGLDFSAAMLGIARELPPAAGADIEWIEANALSMPLPDASFNVAICQQGLQQIPDRVAALREIRRVLEPASRFVGCVWGPLEGNPGMHALVQALGRHVSPAAADNRRAPFALSDSENLRGLLVEAGFRDVQIQTLTIIAGFTSSDDQVDGEFEATPLSTVAGVTVEMRDAIRRDVRAAVARYTDGDQLNLPMEVHFALGQA